MELSSPLVHALERSLDGFAMRHQAIANNIANVNTPGYVTQAVDFEYSLIQALTDDMAPKGPTGDPLDPNAQMPGDEVFETWHLGKMRPVVSPITDAHNAPLLTWQPHMERTGEPIQRLDGNRTAVETEMSSMVANAVKYQAVAAVVQKEFGILRNIAQAK